MSSSFYTPSIEKLRTLGYVHAPTLNPDYAAELAEAEKRDGRMTGAQAIWENSWYLMLGENAWRVIQLPRPDDDHELHLHDAIDEGSDFDGHVLDIWVRLRSELDFDRLLWQIGWSDHEPVERASTGFGT